MEAVSLSDCNMAEAVKSGPFNVLLIEPAPPDQRWMEMMLCDSGIPHTLRVFPTAALALTVLRQETDPTFDIVIVNVVLPMLDIGQAVAALRTLPVLSGATFAVTITAAYHREEVPPGCNALLKPVDVEQLQSLVAPRAIAFPSDLLQSATLTRHGACPG
jgi:CheY-like chemotaxis protein